MKKMGTVFFQQTVVLSFLLFTVIHFSYGQQLAGLKITAEYDSVALQNVINEISEEYLVKFSYLDEVVQDVLVSVDADGLPLVQFLETLLEPTNIKFKIREDFVLLFEEEKKRPVRRITINGFITDEKTGEALAGSHVYLPGRGIGTAANRYGFYSITLKAEPYMRLRYSYIAHATETATLMIPKDTTIHITLAPDDLRLGEVEVTGESSIERQTRMSTVQLEAEQIKKTPTLLGEVDIMKTLQLLPGVHAGNEGMGGVNVRGSSPDQNLVLLDGVQVYNVNHLFGFLSVFNTEAIRDVQFTKGGFPARYGGRLASVIDIDMKEGNMNEFGGSASVGLLASQLTLEGPIQKGKTSFMVSGRRSYADILTRPFIEEDTGYFFYDANLKINHKFYDKHRLYLSSYLGLDQYFFEDESTEMTIGGLTTQKTDDIDFDWGNVTTALRWNALISDRLFSNTTIIFSDYQFHFNSDFTTSVLENTDRDKSMLEFNSGIRDWGARLDFDYFPNPNHSLKFGSQVLFHQYTPETAEIVEISSQEVEVDTTLGGINSLNAREYSAWIENTWKLNEKISMNLGVHASGFESDGEFYYDIQPRVSARYEIRDDLTLKSSFASMKQYVHLLTNNTVSLPTDLWLPSTKRIKPERSIQVAAGIEKYLVNRSYKLTFETYYKKLKNLITYKEGVQSITLSENFADKLESGGEGTAYGAEIFLEKRNGRLTGWFAYTLSWSNRTFENINFGEAYPFKYDRRHDMAFTGSYKLNDTIELAANWIYYTGAAITLEEFEIATLRNLEGPQIIDFGALGRTTESFENRNSIRMRPTHRMDVGVNLKKRNRWGLRTWRFGLYNAYNRRNPAFMFVERESRGIIGPDGSTVIDPVAKEITLFPTLPYVTYKLEF